MRNKANKIITIPHPNLRKRSKYVTHIDNVIKNLVNDMIITTLKWEGSREHEIGVALAAVQINRLVRVIIVRNNYKDKKDRGFTVYINPKITKFIGKPIEDMEGCLSVKNIYGRVARYPRINIEALDMNNKTINMTINGFLARIFQHEIDHTNGIVFLDRINDSTKLFHLKKDGKLIPLQL